MPAPMCSLSRDAPQSVKSKTGVMLAGKAGHSDRCTNTVMQDVRSAAACYCSQGGRARENESTTSISLPSNSILHRTVWSDMMGLGRGDGDDDGGDGGGEYV